ncbi:MAG: S41 family peptidase [Lachnospiraceae bacterium]|nr:S41 family peptidase [Lachnospiraceae bacterium]
MDGNKEMNEREVNKKETDEQEKIERELTPRERMEQIVAELEEEHRKEKELTRPAYWRGLMTGFLICAFLALVMMVSVNTIVKKKSNQPYKVIDTSGSQATIDDIESKLSSLEELVNQYYYYTDKVDMNVIADQIYRAYMSGLKDKYAAYYTKDEMTQRMESVNGSYCGIGAVVSQNDNKEVIVIQPYENSPAEQAGLKQGDIILSIDGTSLAGMTLDEAVSLVKGEEGSSAVFKVKREENEFEVDIVRKQVAVPTVTSEMKEGNVGYVYISSFELTTVDQFTQAVDKLIEDGAKGIVFDLRNNGGGALDAVIDMLDYLLPEGLLMYVEDKYDNRQNYTSDKECVNQEIPMAVLINDKSASASEVFTGALQDYERAKIFGTKSYGKGVVQNLIPLSDGSGIKMTIAEYFTPKGRNFDGNGIDPDETVDLPTEEEAYDERGVLKEGYDTQLNRAVEYIKEQTTE